MKDFMYVMSSELTGIGHYQHPRMKKSFSPGNFVDPAIPGVGSSWKRLINEISIDYHHNMMKYKMPTCAVSTCKPRHFHEAAKYKRL